MYSKEVLSKAVIDETAFRDGLKTIEKAAADNTTGYKLLTKATGQTKAAVATYLKGSSGKAKGAKDDQHTVEVAEPTSLAARLTVAMATKADLNVKADRFNHTRGHAGLPLRWASCG